MEDISMNRELRPDDIQLRQSNEILPIEILDRFKQRQSRNKPCYSAFSNRRFKVNILI